MMLLVALLAVGSDPDAIRLDMVERIPFPSEWELEWVEKDGIPEFKEGKLELGPKRLMLVYENNVTVIEPGVLDYEGRHARTWNLILQYDRSRLLLCRKESIFEKPSTEFTTRKGDGHLVLSFKRKK